MNKEEWIKRYTKHVISISGLDPDMANDLAQMDYEESRLDFDDDPEGCADDQMSYWANDEEPK